MLGVEVAVGTGGRCGVERRGARWLSFLSFLLLLFRCALDRTG